MLQQRWRTITAGSGTLTTNIFIASEVFADKATGDRRLCVCVCVCLLAVNSYTCSGVQPTHGSPPWGLQPLLYFELLPWLSITHHSAQPMPQRVAGKGWNVNMSCDAPKRGSLYNRGIVQLNTQREMFRDCACGEGKVWKREAIENDRESRRCWRKMVTFDMQTWGCAPHRVVRYGCYPEQPYLMYLIWRWTAREDMLLISHNTKMTCAHAHRYFTNSQCHLINHYLTRTGSAAGVKNKQSLTIEDELRLF